MTGAMSVPGRPKRMLEFALDEETYCVGIDAVDDNRYVEGLRCDDGRFTV